MKKSAPSDDETPEIGRRKKAEETLNKRWYMKAYLNPAGFLLSCDVK